MYIFFFNFRFFHDWERKKYQHVVQAYSSTLRNAFTKFSLPVVKQNSTVNELQTKRIKQQFHKSRRGMPALIKSEEAGRGHQKYQCPVCTIKQSQKTGTGLHITSGRSRIYTVLLNDYAWQNSSIKKIYILSIREMYVLCLPMMEATE